MVLMHGNLKICISTVHTIPRTVACTWIVQISNNGFLLWDMLFTALILFSDKRIKNISNHTTTPENS